MQEIKPVQHFLCSTGQGPAQAMVIRNISCLITCHVDLNACEDSTSPHRLGVKNHVDIVIQNGKISAIGKNAGLSFEGPEVRIISGEGLVVMPGLVDAYASPLSIGQLGKESVLRSQGVAQNELVSMGVAGQKARSRAAIVGEVPLQEALMQFLARAKDQGVALQEVKTGYCLSHAQLIEQWRWLCQRQNMVQGLDLHLSFFGLNDADRAQRGMSALIEDLILLLPQIASSRAQSFDFAVDANIDLECFPKELADKWLGAAVQHGFDILLHADRSSRSGGAELAVELARRLDQKKERARRKGRVLSVSHAKYSSDTDLNRLSQNGVGVVVLPSHNQFRRMEQVDAGRLRSSGARVAIGSGYDPLECPFHNLWFSSYLALTECGFSLPEVLGGITREAAFALGAEEHVGRVLEGKPVSLIAFQGNEPADFFNSPLGEHLVWTVSAMKHEETSAKV